MIEVEEKQIINLMDALRKRIPGATIDFGQNGLVIYLRVKTLDMSITELLKTPWIVQSIIPGVVGSTTELNCTFVLPYSELVIGKAFSTFIESEITAKRKHRFGVPIDPCPECKKPGTLRVHLVEGKRVAYVYHKEPKPRNCTMTRYLEQIGKTVADIDKLIDEHNEKRTVSEIAKPIGSAIDIIDEHQPEESDVIIETQAALQRQQYE